jgi:hypothetical protein
MRGERTTGSGEIGPGDVREHPMHQHSGVGAGRLGSQRVDGLGAAMQTVHTAGAIPSR